jgi:hypothetical protein
MSESKTQGPVTEGAGPKPEDPAEGRRQPRDVPVPDLAGRAEQFGAIIVQTLDLAEAGLNLGITVLTRAGAVAQEALGDRMPGGTGSDPVHANGPANDYPANASTEDAVGDDETFFLANRVPLVPGGAVRVSFSITNDSLLESKRVTLKLEALVGDQLGVRIDEAAFAVRPARKTIPPMDFEKFVLIGTLPAEAPPDVYRGAVIVQSTDEMSIPIRLHVVVP